MRDNLRVRDGTRCEERGVERLRERAEKWKRVRAGTHHIVEAYTPALKEDLAREPVDKGKPELGHKERDERG